MSSAPFLTPHNNHPLAPQVPDDSHSSPYSRPPPPVRYLAMELEQQQNAGLSSGSPRPGYVDPFVGPLKLAAALPLQAFVLVVFLCSVLCVVLKRDCNFSMFGSSYCFRFRLRLSPRWTWTARTTSTPATTSWASSTTTTWASSTSLWPLSSLGLTASRVPWSLALPATARPTLLRLAHPPAIVPVVPRPGRIQGTVCGAVLFLSVFNSFSLGVTARLLRLCPTAPPC